MSMEGIQKWYLFCQSCIKGKGVGPRGQACPYKTLLGNQSPMGIEYLKRLNNNSSIFSRVSFFPGLIKYRLLFPLNKRVRTLCSGNLLFYQFRIDGLLVN